MFPVLPKDRVIPDGTGRFLASAAGPLQPKGAPLIVSNSPEQVTDRSLTAGDFALLHRTPVPDWRFRLFYHHLVATQRGLFLGSVLVNQGTRPLEIYISRSSGPVRTRSPIDAGREVLRSYLSGGKFGADVDRYLGTIKPGGTFTLTRWAEAGRTATDIVDLALRDPTGKSDKFQPPPVTLVVLADGRANPRSVEALLSTPVTAPDPVQTHRTRGVFAHADRQGAIRCEIGTDVSFPLFVDLAGPCTGPYARPLVGEFERPMTPQMVGTLPEGNPGNYGVIYDLRVVLTNRFSVPVGITCLLNAAGGPGSSVLGLEEGVRYAPGYLRAFDSWVWQEVTLASGEGRTLPVRFSLPGGANGAHRFYFWPRAI